MDNKRRGMALDALKIVLGAAIHSCSFRFLTFPNHIVSGGVTGIAQILNSLTGILPVGLTIIIINLPLFVWAWRKLGRRFVIMTGFCMLADSVLIDLLAPVAAPITDDALLASVYGGVLNGLGYGLIYTTGATAGGTDIPSRFLRRKYPHINLSTFIMGFNLVIILTYAVVFRRFDSCMYTLICMYITSKVESLILYGPINSRLCYIISDRSDDLRHAITERLGRGATMLQGHGAWSGKEKQVILCVVKPPQLASLRKLVREIDENAFLVVGDARSVYGHGFENILSED